MGGIDRFAHGLEERGFVIERRGNLLLVELDVTLPAAPELNQVGTDPPDDFPIVPPHWLHLRKELVLNGEEGRDSELGDEWRKWSRQYPKAKWPGSDKGIEYWLAQARSLRRKFSDAVLRRNDQ